MRPQVKKNDRLKLKFRKHSKSFWKMLKNKGIKNFKNYRY